MKLIERLLPVYACGLLLVGGYAMAYEEPIYEILLSTADYEVRHYAPYLVAEVDVEGDFDTAGKQAFGILAGYIFGDNRSSRKMEMTVPVASTANPQGTKMAMTAPVTSKVRGDAAQIYTYAFVMEREYDLDSLPVPNDSRIRIKQEPPRTLAVRRYSGFWTESNYKENETALLQALAADQIEHLGEPTLARYNSPITPWFLRRNEVMIEIMWPTARER